MSTDNFIEIVKKYPILYNKNHEHYTDTARRAAAWKAISTEFRVGHENVTKHKWRHLRDSYMKHLKVVANGTNQDRRSYNAKYKNWPWAKQMEFLKPYVTSKLRRVIDPNAIVESVEQPELGPKTMTFEQGKEISEERSREEGNEKNETSASSKKERSKWHVIVADDNVDEPKDMPKIERLVRGTSMDPTDLLFLSYAQTLKTFSEEAQALTKIRIAEIMGNVEIQEVRKRYGQANAFSVPLPTHSEFDSNSN